MRLWYHRIMHVSNQVSPKKRGRPSSGGRDPITPVRMPDRIRDAVDRAIADRGSEMSRSEYIRRVLTEHLISQGFIS